MSAAVTSYALTDPKVASCQEPAARHYMEVLDSVPEVPLNLKLFGLGAAFK
jgi:hypothetical protein